MIEVSKEEYSELIELIRSKQKMIGLTASEGTAFEQNIFNDEYCVKGDDFLCRDNVDSYQHHISICNIKTKNCIFYYDFIEYIGVGGDASSTEVKIEDGCQDVLKKITVELKR